MLLSLAAAVGTGGGARTDSTEVAADFTAAVVVNTDASVGTAATGGTVVVAIFPVRTSVRLGFSVG